MDVNETHSRHHSLPPPSNTNQTRQNFVEILSGTANGCLSELGYLPGMPQRLQELEYQNERWKFENMKLYQDNASLSNLIRQQNDCIKQMHAPDKDKNIKIAELDAELRKTRTQRDELARAQAAKNSTPSQLQRNFAHLEENFVRVLNGYRAMCCEVERLQGELRTLAARHPSNAQPQTHHHPQHQQQQSQQQSQPQQHFQFQAQPPQSSHVQHPQSNHPAQRQSPPTLMQPHVQKYVQQQPLHAISRLQSDQQNTQSLPQGQQQKYPLMQTQRAIFQQTYQSIVPVQSQQHRSHQLSWSMPAPYTPSSQVSFVNVANLQQHPPLFSSGQPTSRPNSKPPHSDGFHAAQSASPILPTLLEPFTILSRIPFPNNSGPPTPVSPSRSSPSQQLFAPPSSSFSPDPLKIVLTPSNKVPASPNELFKTNTSTSAPLTISPQDTYLKSVDQVRSPQVKDGQNFNPNSAGTSTSPVEVSAASQSVNVALGLPADARHHQVNLLKRDSLAQSEGHNDPREPFQKRPRLEGYQLELTANILIDPVASDTEDTVQVFDEDEDVIEVGPDGLRLVKDCIIDLFGEENEGEGRYCKLCTARCDRGYRVEPPKPFVNATNDELQEHCMTEHAEAWDTLRSSV